MKILIVNRTDLKGGAARAALRLHKCLGQNGVDSRMMVQYKMGEDSSVIGPNNKFSEYIFKIRSILDSIQLKAYSNNGRPPFSTSWLPFSGMATRINNSDADIVHFHWLAGGLIRVEDLKKINKPIVLTLHDMWAFTGGCYYDQNCGKYKKKCGSCPVLGSHKEHDLSRTVFERKSNAYDDLNLTVIGLSKWMTKCAGESSLFENKHVVNLPNPIDTKEFNPENKTLAKRKVGASHNKKLILFGAVNATSDPRKGFGVLKEAVQKIQTSNAELGIFGSNEPEKSPGFNFPVHNFGNIRDNAALRMIYCAADVMVVPSLQENLSNTIMESLSCGTPVVAFDIGGNGDMIEHKLTGYLAAPFSSDDLSNGIKWVLQDSNRQQLSLNARHKVMQEFDYRIVAQKYADLYHQILKQQVK